MTKKNALHTAFIALLIVLPGFPCVNATNHEVVIKRPVSVSSPYNKRLYEILGHHHTVQGGSSEHNDFARRVDTLLRTSSHVPPGVSAKTLKKRLLSGPQPLPRLVRDRNSGNDYLYYRACQAHACNETNLGLLYHPESRRMLGQLTVDTQTETLGDASESEKSLLRALAESPLERSH